jgi:antitoxin component YwqK of YwqJK toxin-antitoxin module
MRYLYIVLLILWLCPLAALAENRMENDLNKDGIIDQVLIYDNSGTILQVDMDQNQDGFFEKRQYYSRGILSRIERDTTEDHHMDCTDFFENEKRVRQEKRDTKGILTQVALFDNAGQIKKIQKDTTGDRRFDTHFHFKAGQLVTSTKDTDGNGTANITTFYGNQVPVRQEIDENEDSILDRIVFFDTQGQIQKILKDPYKKDRYQTTLTFENGQMKTRERDSNKNGKPDDITRYENEQPVEQKQDTNFDGRFDIITRFSKGVVQFQEKDLDFDGISDFFADFDDTGKVLKTREDTSGNGQIDRIRHYRSGTLYKVAHDHDGDEFFETVSLMENDRIVKNLIDKNRDGTPDVEVFFNENQHRDRLISDNDFNGTPDTWQYYTDDVLIRVETDENGDGNVDHKVYYKNGQKTHLVRDTSFDGHFDTTQRYDDPKWSLIVTQDISQNGQPDIRSFFKGEVLRRKEVDETLDGTLDLVETYDENGNLKTLEELKKGNPWLTWYYDPGEILVRGEEDKNQDGVVEIWYLYEHGRLVTVQEDTTLDGKPDLWETYDETQAMVKRERDLDFDGTPDFVETIGQAETDS